MSCRNSTFFNNKNGSKINSEFYTIFQTSNDCWQMLKGFELSVKHAFKTVFYSLNFFDRQCLLLFLYQSQSHCAHNWTCKKQIYFHPCNYLLFKNTKYICIVSKMDWVIFIENFHSRHSNAGKTPGTIYL